MNDISCGICRNLIPLVKDGVASEDSRAAVARHLEGCPACRALLEGVSPPAADGSERAFARLLQKIRLFAALLMMLGIFFGLSLADMQMFYNSLIMPVIGGLGYLVFRQKALWRVPLLLLCTHLLTNFLSLLRGAGALDLYSLVMWTFLYGLFALIGVVIAWLLHFAFKKED